MNNIGKLVAKFNQLCDFLVLGTLKGPAVAESDLLVLTQKIACQNIRTLIFILARWVTLAV